MLLGVQTSAVPKMVRRGDLHPREGRPSLRRSEVLELAHRRRQEAAELEERRNRTPKAPAPPDTEHEWLRIGPAAAVLGISKGTLSNRVGAGLVPCTVHDHRRWFRLDLLEMIVRARAARETGSAQPGVPRGEAPAGRVYVRDGEGAVP